MDKIKNYPMYQIDEQGNVFSLHKNRLLKPYDNNGYKMIFITGKWCYIHRLMALQYIPIPDRLRHLQELWVNHKNGNKSDNQLYNLEWTSISENIRHSYTTLGRQQPTGLNHWNTGKKASKETIQKMSESKKGTKHPKFKGWYVTPAGRFPSSIEAAEPNNTYAKRVYRLCLSGIPGWSFDPVP
jgi:hypothetical protein